jgi:predicted amidohydrolase
MYKNSATVPGNATQRLSALAKIHCIIIGIGMNEKVESGPGNATIYNSFLLFGETGDLLIHHRKLIPTYTERLLFGQGDGKDLRSVDTAIGRIGGLICWEHFMPLTRQAMHNQGELIHLAFWPCVHEMHQVASRHYAFEGRCFVVAVGNLMKVKDIPPELELPVSLAGEPEEWLLNGGSCVIAPDGFYDLKPQYNNEGIIYHELDDPEHALRERLTLDVSGHFQRTDIFAFEVKRK